MKNNNNTNKNSYFMHFINKVYVRAYLRNMKVKKKEKAKIKREEEILDIP